MGHDTLPQRCALLDSDEAGRTYGRPHAGRLGRRLGKRDIVRDNGKSETCRGTAALIAGSSGKAQGVHDRTDSF